MSRHLITTLIALIAFGFIGVFGVWVTHKMESQKLPEAQQKDESVSSVVDSVLKRINK